MPRNPTPRTAKPKRVRRPKGLVPFATSRPIIPKGPPSVVINETWYESEPWQLRAYAAWLNHAAAWIEQEKSK